MVKVIGDDPRLQVKAFSETSYLEGETQTATAYQAMGLAVAFILAGGALFGAMNTMYAAVAGRVREIATLRVSPEIFVAGLLFSIAICVAGGLLPASQAARLSITQALREI